MLGRSGQRLSIPEGVGGAPSSSTGTGTTYRQDCIGEAKRVDKWRLSGRSG